MLDQSVALPPFDTDRAFVNAGHRNARTGGGTLGRYAAVAAGPARIPGIPFYFKDEAAHPTGSLKHRLARSLFLYALCNGRLRVGPDGGRCLLWQHRDLGGVVRTAAWPALHRGDAGLYGAGQDPGCGVAGRKVRSGRGSRRRSMRERRGMPRKGPATWTNSAWPSEQPTGVATTISPNRSWPRWPAKPDPEPAWIVCGVGTGGTSATIGRFLRYKKLGTRLCVAEPTGSAFARGWKHRDRGALANASTVIEGIGRPQGRALLPVRGGGHGDRSERRRLDRRRLANSSAFSAAAMAAHPAPTSSPACNWQPRCAPAARRGSIVSLLCDLGERYDETLFDRAWLVGHGLDIEPRLRALREHLSLRCVQLVARSLT